MKKISKKCVTILLALTLVICVAVPVNGTGIGTQESVFPHAKLQDKYLLIPEDVAEYIAQYFIEDIVATGMTDWNSNTSILNCVPTYDIDGENITSYTFELANGYVTVAAYIDMPNPIIEWSDKGKPGYADFKTISPNEKVIYTGPFSYYLRKENGTLESTDGTTIDQNNIENKFSALRNAKNIPSAVIETFSRTSEEVTVRPYGYGDVNDKDGYISNAGIYAKNVYGGSWTCTDWNNKWENYVNYAIDTDFLGYSNHCGPVAITNAIKMYGNKYNNSTIKSSSNKTIFSKVIQANTNAGGIYYSSSRGTPPSTADDFIRSAFKMCNVTVRTYGQYKCNLQNLKNATTSDRLMFICLDQYGPPYNDHAALGFAWSCMTRSSDGTNMYFVKIADGLNSSGRYLDLDVLKYDYYWEIKF